MSAEPLVSVGCAVYNGEATLERALASIVGQDYRNLEILISDDGSTDRSRDIAAACARADARVRILDNDGPPGMMRNFNRLFAHAAGRYFMLADQDDFRDRTFVRKAVAALEADSRAVLCQSHTAQFIGGPGDVKLIVTLDGVENVQPRVARYWRFLRHYSDTTLYGLIRADALRQTTRWSDSLGAANALLFELVLRGTFVQIPEVLYFYSARGLRNRTTPRQDYARMHPGKTLPRFYFPFLRLARNQTMGIWRSGAALIEKIGLTTVLWADVVAVFLAKAIYRTWHRLAHGRVPGRVTRICQAVVDSSPDMRTVGNTRFDDDEFPHPAAWTLLGESLRARAPRQEA